MHSSALTLQASVLKPGNWKGVIILSFLCSTVSFTPVFAAMDAVIPGMEKATEAQKKAVLMQRSRDSVREQEEVGRQRFEKRMLYKNNLIEGMRMEAAARKGAIARELEAERLAIQDSRDNASDALRIFACMGVLSSGAFLFRRQISSFGWVVALEEWLTSARPEAEDPANRIARLERMSATHLAASASAQSSQSASQDSQSLTSPSPGETDSLESNKFLPLLLCPSLANQHKSNSTSAGSLAPVDMRELLACANGDVQNMSEMALLYLEQTRTRIDKIRAALTSGSNPEAIRWTKMSASASELCGMKSISIRFEKLQETIEKGPAADALAMVDSVDVEYNRIREFLQNHPALKNKSAT